MARCGCAGSAVCNCLVTAGPNVTVTGTGQAGNPYVVSANASSVDTTDSPTIDFTTTPGNPTIITGDVKVDGNFADPTNLITMGPNGLRVDCETIADQCNIGIVANDTITVNHTLAAGQLTSDVKLDGQTPGNLIKAIGPLGPNSGIRVDCSDVQGCFDAGLGISAPALATGLIQVCLSTDGGNTLSFGADGCLYASGSAGTPVTTADTPTIDLSDSTAPLTADVIFSADPDNIASAAADGVLVQIVTDCGITGNGTPANPLRANVNPTFPFACTVDNGTDIYCDTATGRLQGDPEKFQIDLYRSQSAVNAPTQVGALAGVGANAIVGPNGLLDVTNPSPCRPMILKIEGGVRHAQLVKGGAAGASNVLFGADIIQTAGPNIGFVPASGDFGHQQWGRNDNGPALWDSMGSESIAQSGGANPADSSQYLLPPGATVTFAVRGHLQLVSTNGATTINAWVNYVRVTGYNI